MFLLHRTWPILVNSVRHKFQWHKVTDSYYSSEVENISITMQKIYSGP